MDIISLNTPYNENIDDNTPIFRYYSYCKLQKLFDDKALFFCNTQKFSDRRERELPMACLNGFPTDSATLVNKVHTVKVSDIASYTLCFSKSNDNYAFWKIYTPNNDGVMIATTVGKLKKVLSNNNVVIFNVDYVDDDYKCDNAAIIDFGPDSMPSSIRGTEKFKIFPYKYEEEIRFVFYSKDKEKGYNYPISDMSFIDYFMISPFANKAMEKCIEDMIRQYLPEIEIKKSIIDESE